MINQTLLTYRYGEGFDALVVLLRDDAWGNSLISALDAVYAGEIVGIPYDPEFLDVTECLEIAEEAAEELGMYGYDRVGVLMLAFDEAVDFLIAAGGFPTIFDLSWFGTELMGSTAILVYAAVEAMHVHLVYAQDAPPSSTKFIDLSDRLASHGGGDAGFYTATAADAAWLIVETYLDIKASKLAPITGGDMALIFRDNAANYYGYSGWTSLDENGDRNTIDYDILGFGPDPDTGDPTIIHYGYFDTLREVLHWTYEPPPWD